MKKILFFIMIIAGSLFLTSCFNNDDDLIELFNIEYYVLGEKENLNPKQYMSELKTYLPTYEKSGYLFLGWYNNESFSGEEVKIISEGEVGDKKFYAKLTKLHKLTLFFNGGTVVDYQKYFTALDEVVLPENIYNNDLYFLGWYDNVEFTGNKVTKIDVGTNEDKTFYARFEEMNNTSYYLTLNFNGGEELEYESLISHENDYILPTDVYKENYEFVGWYHLPIAQGERVYKIDKNTSNNVILYAVFDLSSTLFDQLDMYDEELLVTNNLTFPLTVNGYDVTYISSNSNIINEEGILKREYNKSFVTITAEITDYVTTIHKDYTYQVDGYKSLDGPIRSGYIYREYFKANDYYFLNQEIVYTAFSLADSNGNFTANSNNSYFGNVRSNIMPKAKELGVRVIMSVGPSSEWGSFSKTESLRENFAENVVLLINEHGFDGVDIDWEVPRPAYGEHLLYTLLMEAVHRKVKENNPDHLVTTAITGGNSQPPKYDLHNSGKYIDYINIMTYGMAGNSGMYQNALYGRSGFHNPTLGVGRPPAQATIHDSIRIFNDFGIENKRLIVGVAFYGMKQIRTYNQATNSYSGWTSSPGGLRYLDIEHELNKEGYFRVYDEVSQVPYIINDEGTVFISYDDTESIKAKAEYIIANKIGGMMYWEHMHDHDNILLKAMCENMPRS